MIKSITFGYRWEGLALHQWAFVHTELQAIVLPRNRSNMVIEDWAEAFSVPVLYQSDSDIAKLVHKIKKINPDIILCHCYTYKLPIDILRIPRLGCVNIHPGKLPTYAGRNPIEDALGNLEPRLWATLHYMNEEYDSGEKIDEVSIESNRNNVPLMRSELTKQGLRILERSWDTITKQ